uniref:Double-stranded DNA-binding protein n=1 Tax=Thermosphaera aggregans TaxID=54254 RepID=A0A7C2BKR3_9CREN
MKLYKKYLAKLANKSENTASPKESVVEDPEKFVQSRLSDERAEEIMMKIKIKYPEIYDLLVKELYRAIKQGIVNELDGLTLLSIAQSIGLDVRPDLRIRFVKNGKEVDMKEYLGK